MYDSYDETPDYYVDIDVSLVMDRRSTLDKKVADPHDHNHLHIHYH